MPKKNKTPREDPLQELVALLLELNLTTLAKELTELLRTAEKSHMGYSQFLAEALGIEQAARLSRRIQRRGRRSKLGPLVSLDKFDVGARPQLEPQFVKELLTCRFVDEKRNVILVGRSSTGKTTVARSIGHAACERGFSVYATSMEGMLEALHASRADGSYRKAFRRVTACELLVIDDAGFSTLDRKATNELFRIVCARHRVRSTIVVTNLPFRKWGEFLPSPAQAVAIADRLVDNATILRFSGKPFRKPRDISGAPLEDE